MILHYLRQKENKDQAKANIIYTDIINLVNLFFKNNINFDKRNFLNTFYITSFFLYITFYITKSNLDKNSKIISQNLMDNFINDLDHTLSLEGIGDMKIGKFVKFYVKKFYYYLKIFDKRVSKKNTIKVNEFFIENGFFSDFNLEFEQVEIIYKLIKKLIVILKKHQINSSVFIKL